MEKQPSSSPIALVAKDGCNMSDYVKAASYANHIRPPESPTGKLMPD